MREHNFYPLTFLVVAMLVISFPSHGIAQVASGVPGDQIDDIAVKIGEVQELFTAVKDAAEPDQWYYIPDKPRVSESRGADGNAEPDFTLVRYQMSDPTNPTKLVSGGVLVFSARLSVPAEAHQQIAKAISDKTKKQNIKLGPMPIKSSRIHMYAPDGQFITSAAQGEGVGPAFSSQKMTFSVNLTQVGTQVLDAMSESAGIPVYVHMKYRKLTPKMGFKIKVNWQSIRDFYSSDAQFRSQVSYFGLYGGSANASASTIRDKLTRGGHITIESVTGEGFKPEDLDKVMQPFITRINATILDFSKPPEKIAPASAELGEKKGSIISAQAGYAVKKQLDVTKLNDTIDYTTRSIEESETIASGTIGIGGYKEEVRKRHIVNIKPGQFSTAYFALPAVGDNLGIDQITLQVDCRVDEGNKLPATAVWTKQTGSWHWKNQPAQFLWFPLMSITGDDPAKIKKTTFVATYNVVSGGQSFTRTQKHEGFNGDIALIPAETVANVITIDASSVPWTVLDPQNGKVDQVTLELKAGEKTFNQNISPRKVDGQWLDPPVNRMLVERGANVVPKVQFRLKDGQRVAWAENGKQITAGEEGNYQIQFFASDIPDK